MQHHLTPRLPGTHFYQSAPHLLLEVKGTIVAGPVVLRQLASSLPAKDGRPLPSRDGRLGT